MSTRLSIEDRQIRLEARKLAIETYIKVHVERAAAATQLVTSYFRLIFTLSLGTLAAIVTLGSAWARFGAASPGTMSDKETLLIAIAAITCLILSAVLAANGLRHAAGGSLRLIRDPLPETGSAIETALLQQDADEHDIIRHVLVSLDEIASISQMQRPSFLPPLIAYLIATMLALYSMVRLSL